MQVHMKCKPSYTSAFCVLNHGEGLYVESGAMMAMSSGFTVKAGIGTGGIGKALLRRAIGGESFFMAHYVAEHDQSWVAVAPPFPGDMDALDLQGESWLIETGSLVAASDTLEVDIRYTGVRMAMLQEGIAMLKVHGTGIAVISSYGGLLPFELGEDEVLIVDTGHLVALTEGVSWKLGIVGGVVTTSVSGEGLVASLRGPGRVLLQTRSEQNLRSWLAPEQRENEQS